MANTLSAEDKLAVGDLIASYALYIDQGDEDSWVNNFLPDATLEPMGQTISGQDEIRAWLKRLMAFGRVGTDPAQLIHFNGLPRVEGEGDRATAQTYCAVIDYDPEKKIRMPLVVRYEDTCAKVDGRWRFQRRVIHGELGTPTTPRP